MLVVKGVIETLVTEKDEYGNDYIKGTIGVPRSSGTIDTVYFRTDYTDDKYLHFKDSMNTGNTYLLRGSLRTYETKKDLPRYRTVLYVKGYEPIAEDPDINEFNGWLTVHKIGEKRLTPAGTTILDLTMFSERMSGMRDKIPVICFNKTADFASKYIKPGMKVKVIGRFQSRDYVKDLSDTTSAYVTINELVASYITIPGGEHNE